MSNQSVSLSLPRARLTGHGLEFSDSSLGQALALGAFLLQIPSSLDVSPGFEICRNFYRPRRDAQDLLRGHREDPHERSKLGYEDRPNQVEQLQIESHLWREYFPLPIARLLGAIKVVTLQALRHLFEASGVHQDHWATITGGTLDETSLCYTTLNHYRSGVRGTLGIVEHTDSGFITVIAADQPGFEIYHQGMWQAVPLEPGCFIVNLGDAYQILTAHLRLPGRAVLHRVIETVPVFDTPDRSSFTVYMGPNFDMSLYQYSGSGALEVYQSFRAFSVLKAQGMGYGFHDRV